MKGNVYRDTEFANIAVKLGIEKRSIWVNSTFLSLQLKELVINTSAIQSDISAFHKRNI